MKTSTYTDSAIKILMYLTFKSEEHRLFNVPEVSRACNLTQNQVSKIVNNLKSLNYLKTFRGRHGGFKLSKLPEEISIGKLVKDIDSSVELKNDVSSVCPFFSTYDMKSAALKAYLSVLDSYNLCSLTRENKELFKLMR